MPEYRVKIGLESPVATPFHSGTIFGHLCWAYRHEDGEAALVQWLRDLGQAPFLVSDGFPAGWLPIPRLAPARPPRPNGPVYQAAEAGKRLRKAEWLRLEDFLEIRGALSPSALEPRLSAVPPATKTSRTARNSINRMTGTTLASGGLFFVDEWWPREGEEREIWVSADISADRLAGLFRFTGQHGYGADAGVGRGRFSVTVETAPAALFNAVGSNRRMTLSHGTRSSNMEDSRYRIQTHFGKLGALYATGGKPFKCPVALLRPGATFHPMDAGPYGELLRGVHRERSEICHNAWHLTVPYTEKEANS